MKEPVKFIIALLIPLLVGAISGYFTSESVETWYRTLVKPDFNPPNWLFAPVWTSLYVMMGIACFLVWKSNVGNVQKKNALWLYAVQLALNFCWSFIFFYLREPGWAVVEIVALWVMILLTIITFMRISKVAGWLLIPYLAWVSFASVLNYAIWHLNGQG